MHMSSNSITSVAAPRSPIGSPKLQVFDSWHYSNPSHCFPKTSCPLNHSDKPTSDAEYEKNHEKCPFGYATESESPEMIAGSRSGSNASSIQQPKFRKPSWDISRPFAATSSVLGFGVGTSDTSSIRAVRSLKGSDMDTIEAMANGSAGINESRASDLFETSRPRAQSMPTNAKDSNHGRNLAPRPLSPGSQMIASTGTKMEKVLRIHFLPRFLRTRNRGAARKGKHAIEQTTREKERSEPNGICFDARIDDGEKESTKKPTFRRPVYVKHDSKTMVGLMETLETGPGEDKCDSLQEKPPSTKYESADFDIDEDDETDGTSGIPEEPTEQDMGHQPGNMDIPSRDSASDTANSLETHPDPPIRKRTVTFPLPPNVEVKPEHRFLRQSVVCTPYPHTYKNVKQRDENTPKAVITLQGAISSAMLTVALCSLATALLWIFMGQNGNNHQLWDAGGLFDGVCLNKLIQAER